MYGVCANVCANNIMINRNASCYVSIIYASTWLLWVFFAASLQSVCVHDVRYISKYFVLSMFYSFKYTITPLLYLIRFVCAHSYLFQLFAYNEYKCTPYIAPFYSPHHPLPLSHVMVSGAAHLQIFYFFSKFKLVFPLLSS